MHADKTTKKPHSEPQPAFMVISAPDPPEPSPVAKPAAPQIHKYDEFVKFYLDYMHQA
ncbi:hypothetical protein GCM10023186_18850 [Hymenobacter koreensis]|uniref:Uncharacterized protein n=1 Tax=Hymenobacter koreensis TaxID=1084523 RepID=A0ABP8IYI8_9BACT